MAYPENMRRTVILKASRETLLLVTAACGLTFALAYGIHSRPPPPTLVATTENSAVPQDWTGGLVDISPVRPTVTEPLTSAALTVPKSALALPTVPRPAPAKLHACDGAACPAKIAALPAPMSRREVPAERLKVEPRHRDQSLMTRLNPLNHVPDMVRKPFAYAGDTVTGWFRSF